MFHCVHCHIGFRHLEKKIYLGVFAKLPKVTVNFIMSVHCLSVCLSFRMKQLGSNWMDFHQINTLVFFQNLSRKFH
jgi:hypothetical protein